MTCMVDTDEAPERGDVANLLKAIAKVKRQREAAIQAKITAQAAESRAKRALETVQRQLEQARAERDDLAGLLEQSREWCAVLDAKRNEAEAMDMERAEAMRMMKGDAAHNSDMRSFVRLVAGLFEQRDACRMQLAEARAAAQPKADEAE